MPDFSWLDLGNWGLFDLILFIFIVISGIVLFFIVFGIVFRRLADLIFPSVRRTMTNISEDELEKTKEIDTFKESTFYIEDGILDRNPKEFLEEKGIINQEINDVLYYSNKNIEDLLVKENEYKNERELIMKAYENNIFKNSDLTPDKLNEIVDERLGPLVEEDSENEEENNSENK